MLNTITNYVKLVTPNDTEKFLMSIGGFLGAWFSTIVGGYDECIKWLALLVAIDYFSGTVAALKNGEWCSTQSFQGLFKKVFLFVIIGVCNALDHVLNVEFFRNISLFAYAVNEAGSVVENIEKMGFGSIIPNFLKQGLKVLKEKESQLLEKGLNKHE